MASEAKHGFWLHFLGKIGAPVFSATLVGCLLTEHLGWLHSVLLWVGLVLIFVEHRMLERA